MAGLNRRDVSRLLGGCALAWPISARAQQPTLPLIGFLSSATGGPGPRQLPMFRRAFAEAGFVEGQNVAIEYRFADNQYDRLPALAAELVSRAVNIIVAASLPAALAAKAATTSVPIVFSSGGDPVEQGLVASLNRPSGNVTGVSTFGVALVPKRLQLLLDVAPATRLVAVLVNPGNARSDLEIAEIEAAAQAVGQRILAVKVGHDGDFDAAFAGLVAAGAGGLLVAGDPFFVAQRGRVIALAARHRLPAIYDQRVLAAAGGLISYGASRAEMVGLAAGYVARILKGAKPADLPVLQPTRLELVVNLKTAQALGVTIPQTVLVAADEVIE